MCYPAGSQPLPDASRAGTTEATPQTPLTGLYAQAEEASHASVHAAAALAALAGRMTERKELSQWTGATRRENITALVQRERAGAVGRARQAHRRVTKLAVVAEEVVEDSTDQLRVASAVLLASAGSGGAGWFACEFCATTAVILPQPAEWPLPGVTISDGLRASQLWGHAVAAGGLHVSSAAGPGRTAVE